MEPFSELIKSFMSTPFAAEHIELFPYGVFTCMLRRKRTMWKPYHDGRLSFLSVVIDHFPEPIFHGEWDSPICLKGNWPEVEQNEWIIPKDVDKEEFYNFLKPGGGQSDWFIYKKDDNKTMLPGSYYFYDIPNILKYSKLNDLTFLFVTYHHYDPWFFHLRKDI